MPRKKKVNTAATEIIEVQDEINKVAVEKEAICGHRNLHAQGNVTCILQKGHADDHSDGKYAWSDMAGTASRKHA